MGFLLPSPIQKIESELLQQHDINLYIKRDDLIHPNVPGNKWRKLKYHFEDARNQGKNTILTVGGAFSNHITATAAACKELGFRSIGIIRGDELNKNSNTALQFAAQQGMELFFIDRMVYAKAKNDFEMLCSHFNKQDFRNAYFVPEGGATELGRKGCAELVDEIDVLARQGLPGVDFDYIVCACGTGTTIAGIAQNLKDYQQAIGIAVLNDESIEAQIKKASPEVNQLSIIHYPFGGYAKATPVLIQFIKDFYAEHHILLDYVYTGKMLFGLFDLIKEGELGNSTIVAVHTGGVMNANVFGGDLLKDIK